MRRSEAIFLSAIFLLALGGIIYNILRPKAKAAPVHLEQALATPASDLLANRHVFLGDVAASYTLIEFGDYECSPCRASRSDVKGLLNKYKNKLKLDFRNLPLPGIHSNAMYSAIVAEAARDKHCFWEVHNTLYETVLSDHSIDKVVEEKLKEKKLSNLQMQRARKAVETDMQIANKLGLTETPIFLLACPDGKLYNLDELASASNHIK